MSVYRCLLTLTISVNNVVLILCFRLTRGNSGNRWRVRHYHLPRWSHLLQKVDYITECIHVVTLQVLGLRTYTKARFPLPELTARVNGPS